MHWVVGRYHTGKVTRHEKSQRPTFTEDFILLDIGILFQMWVIWKRILTRKNNFENFYFNRTRSARNLDMELKSHDLKMAPSGGSKNNGPMKSESQQSIVSRPEEEYVVYARRWFILIVIVILNLSNAMVRTRIFLKKPILSWQQSYQWLCYLKQKFGQVYHCLCKMHLKWVSFKAMYRYVEMLILNRLIDYICFYIYLDVKDTCILLWFLFIFEVHVQLWIFRELKKCSVWLFSKQNVFWSSPCYLIYI